MWTNLTLSLHPVWDDCLWSLSATWVDDCTGESQIIGKTGQTPLHGADDPKGILAVAVGQILLELDSARQV